MIEKKKNHIHLTIITIIIIIKKNNKKTTKSSSKSTLHKFKCLPVYFQRQSTYRRFNLHQYLHRAAPTLIALTRCATCQTVYRERGDTRILGSQYKPELSEALVKMFRGFMVVQKLFFATLLLPYSLSYSFTLFLSYSLSLSHVCYFDEVNGRKRRGEGDKE